MKLEYIETKEKTTNAGTYHSHKVYTIEGYTVEIDDAVYSSGDTFHDITVLEPWDPNAGRTYLPKIYYYKNEDCFKIQTISYSAMTVDEFKKFLAANQKALEIAEILTKEFITKKQKEG